jgi:IS5 family transposase
VLGGFGPRQLAEKSEDLRPSAHSSESQLADDEWVSKNEPILEKPTETGISAPQVVDPDGRVDERQSAALRPDGGRRRRARRRPFSEPSSAASRRALSRATRASRPAWTIAVFSFRPVSLRALSSSSSSRISVVLICINMAYLYASVKRRREDLVRSETGARGEGHGALLNPAVQFVTTTAPSASVSGARRITRNRWPSGDTS